MWTISASICLQQAVSKFHFKYGKKISDPQKQLIQCYSLVPVRNKPTNSGDEGVSSRLDY